MKWLVLSMRVISTLARLRARAAEMPPNPPPIIRTRGRARASGKSLLERSGGQGHEKHQKYQQHTVGCCCTESQRAELGKDLHRDRAVCMGIEYNTSHKFTDSSHCRE